MYNQCVSILPASDFDFSAFPAFIPKISIFFRFVIVVQSWVGARRMPVCMDFTVCLSLILSFQTCIRQDLMKKFT